MLHLTNFFGTFPVRHYITLEAMAQAGGFLVLNTIPNPETKLMYFTGIINLDLKR